MKVNLSNILYFQSFTRRSFNYLKDLSVAVAKIVSFQIGGMVSNPLVLTMDIWEVLPFLIAASVAVMHALGVLSKLKMRYVLILEIASYTQKLINLFLPFHYM